MEQPHITTPEQQPKTAHPRIYVASLCDYVNGRLHGVWIDATDEPDDIHATIQQMLDKSPEPGAEEIAIHDYDGFGGFAVNEYDTIETVHKIACGIAEHGEAFAAYVELVGTEDATSDDFSDHYHGTYASLRDFVDQFVEDMGWGEELNRLRERSGMGMFLELNYDALETIIRTEWSVHEGQSGVHVFSS